MTPAQQRAMELREARQASTFGESIMLIAAALVLTGAVYGLSTWQPSFHASCVNVDGGDECTIHLG